MSCFKLPDGIYDKLESLIRQFWWAKGDRDRGICWKDWNHVQLSRQQGGLGFKDLRCFNQALLAKQGWRIINKPDSLSSKVIKAKYFSNSDFWKAELGNSPSYAWRSILYGRDLLVKGRRWKIGNGLSCRLSDTFIPTHNNFRIYTVMEGEGDLVGNFFTQERTWDVIRLSATLWPIDVEAIEAIPIPSSSCVDRLIWDGESNGFYSVKSGYRLAMSMKNSDANISSLDWGKRFWETLWKIKVPKKLLHFMWRLFYDILPTTNNLIRRNIPVSSKCPMCGVQEENVAHLFTKCKLTVQVWQQLGWDKSLLRIEGNFSRWLSNLILTANPDERGLFTIFFWEIWLFRNGLVFKEEMKKESSIAASVLDSWEECSKVLTKGDDTGAAMSCTTGWSKPAPGYVKLSFDGAIDLNRETSGAGVILRRDNGSVLAGRCVAGPLGFNSRMVEAVALREGLKLALYCNVRRLEIEGDAKILLEDFEKMVKGVVPEDVSEIWDILLECVGLVNGFDASKIKWIHRDFNKAAHGLASRARTSIFSFQFFDRAPPWLENLCYNDVIGTLV